MWPPPGTLVDLFMNVYLCDRLTLKVSIRTSGDRSMFINGRSGANRSRLWLSYWVHLSLLTSTSYMTSIRILTTRTSAQRSWFGLYSETNTGHPTSYVGSSWNLVYSGVVLGSIRLWAILSPVRNYYKTLDYRDSGTINVSPNIRLHVTTNGSSQAKSCVVFCWKRDDNHVFLW